MAQEALGYVCRCPGLPPAPFKNGSISECEAAVVEERPLEACDCENGGRCVFDGQTNSHCE